MEERKAEKREPNPQVKKPAEKPYPEKRERKRPQAAKRPPKKAVAKLLRKKEGETTEIPGEEGGTEIATGEGPAEGGDIPVGSSEGGVFEEEEQQNGGIFPGAQLSVPVLGSTEDDQGGCASVHTPTHTGWALALLFLAMTGLRRRTRRACANPAITRLPRPPFRVPFVVQGFNQSRSNPSEDGPQTVSLSGRLRATDAPRAHPPYHSGGICPNTPSRGIRLTP